MSVKKRVLLVQAWLDRPQRFFAFPIGLAVVAGRLLPQHEVRGFDPNAWPEPMASLRSAVQDFQPDFVGVSLRNLDTTNYFDPHIYYNGFVATVRQLRELLPHTPLAAGGPGFSLLPQRIMQDLPELDFGIFLEGEKTFPELLENLGEPWRVPGLYWRRQGEIQFTGPRELLQFDDDAPLPAWEVFDLAPYRKLDKAIGVETKRGCAYTCVYCCYYLLNGHRYRLKSPARVLRELKAIRELGFGGVAFTDSVFNTPSRHAREILTVIRDEMPGFSWSAYLSPVGLDDEFVELCLETGMTTLVFSPDTVTDEALEAMGKQMTMQTLEQAVDIIRRHPPACMGLNFFVNGPKYSWKTLLAFMAFALRTKRKLGKRFALLPLLKMGYIRVEPGTPIERIARQEGVLEPDVDLLPRDVAGFDKTFYFNRNLRLFNILFGPAKRYTRRLVVRLLRNR